MLGCAHFFVAMDEPAEELGGHNCQFTALRECFLKHLGLDRGFKVCALSANTADPQWTFLNIHEVRVLGPVMAFLPISKSILNRSRAGFV